MRQNKIKAQKETIEFGNSRLSQKNSSGEVGTKPDFGRVKSAQHLKIGDHSRLLYCGTELEGRDGFP